VGGGRPRTGGSEWGRGRSGQARGNVPGAPRHAQQAVHGVSRDSASPKQFGSLALLTVPPRFRVKHQRAASPSRPVSNMAGRSRYGLLPLPHPPATRPLGVSFRPHPNFGLPR